MRRLSVIIFLALAVWWAPVCSAHDTLEKKIQCIANKLIPEEDTGIILGDEQVLFFWYNAAITESYFFSEYTSLGTVKKKLLYVLSDEPLYQDDDARIELLALQ